MCLCRSVLMPEFFVVIVIIERKLFFIAGPLLVFFRRNFLNLHLLYNFAEQSRCLLLTTTPLLSMLI